MLFATLLTINVFASVPPERLLTGLTVAAERLALPSNAVKVQVDGINQRIYLSGAQISALQKTSKASRICPSSTQTAGGLILECTHKRVYARVELDQGKPFLDLRILRGIPPFGAFDQIKTNYVTPEHWDVSEICPGLAPAARAECQLRDGKPKKALKLFSMATEELSEQALSKLRLGDLAQERMEWNKALEYYRSIPVPGKAMRFADAHVCELTGNCLEKPSAINLFDSNGLVEPLQTEMELRGLRALAYGGFDEALLFRLKQRLENGKRKPLCNESMDLCHTLMTACLRSLDQQIRLQSLELFVSGKMPLKGGRHRVVAEAAADVAVELGAPGFAANLLSSATSDVPTVELADYLLRIIELYTAANDLIRAGVIVDFAQTRLSASEWTKAQARLKELELLNKPLPEIQAKEFPEVDLAQELARVAVMRSQLRPSPKASEKP